MEAKLAYETLFLNLTLKRLIAREFFIASQPQMFSFLLQYTKMRPRAPSYPFQFIVHRMLTSDGI
jgi:hypothetical protein